jgi:hypothetical protein
LRNEGCWLEDYDVERRAITNSSSPPAAERKILVDEVTKLVEVVVRQRRGRESHEFTGFAGSQVKNQLLTSGQFSVSKPQKGQIFA